ncbi:MAG: fibronectin type III domain-containing protein [Vicinamibacterales bacterium]|nr:fibronectin type III domain-containing protein [Vicinamibacterales bacterium]MDP6608158.1 fibronectin type III domain-containing protein [Vicinamibacterales bacterium]
MSQPRRRSTAAVVLAALLAAAGCGKKGPPLAPLRIVATPPADFAVRRLGTEVYVQFILPSTNSDGSTPADLASVEVYAITIGTLLPGVTPLTDEELFEAATLLATIDVEPPVDSEAGDPAASPTDAAVPVGALPEDDSPSSLPAQGESVTVRERLTAEAQLPADLSEVDRRFEVDADAEVDAEAPTVVGLTWVRPPVALPFFDPPPRRTYLAVGRTVDGDAGLSSARLTVRLDGAPSAPPAPAVNYTVDTATVTWLAARGATRPVQAPPVVVSPIPVAAEPGALPVTPAAPAVPMLLPSTPAIASAESTRYNVYRYAGGAKSAPAAMVMPAPVNAAPIDGLEWLDPTVEFDVERCYVVRAVAMVDGSAVESEPSPSACVEFRDTFPPAAPQNLAAVGSAGAVSLIWEPSPDSDLAGYLVLRGEAPGGTLQPLMTAPVTETTYRDDTGTAGVTYIYEVIAVDAASPSNTSEPSNRVTESPQ